MRLAAELAAAATEHVRDDEDERGGGNVRGARARERRRLQGEGRDGQSVHARVVRPRDPHVHRYQRRRQKTIVTRTIRLVDD